MRRSFLVAAFLVAAFMAALGFARQLRALSFQQVSLFVAAIIGGVAKNGRLIFFVVRTVLLKLLYGCCFLRRAEATLSGATRSVTDFANPPPAHHIRIEDNSGGLHL